MRTTLFLVASLLLVPTIMPALANHEPSDPPDEVPPKSARDAVKGAQMTSPEPLRSQQTCPLSTGFAPSNYYGECIFYIEDADHDNDFVLWQENNTFPGLQRSKFLHEGKLRWPDRQLTS